MPAYAHDQYERGRHVMAETETDKSSAASSVEKGSSGKPHSIITYGINIAITTANPDENILDRRLKRAAVDSPNHRRKPIGSSTVDDTCAAASAHAHHHGARLK